jgi:hypothetical protein
MTHRIEFAHHRRRGSLPETLIAIGGHICARELGKRAMHNGSAQHCVDARSLSERAALGR